MGETIELTLVHEDGSEETIEIPSELWERFEALAEEKGIPVDKLFEIAVDTYLKDKGY